MDGLSLSQALSNLRHYRNNPELARCSREALVSFVWIDTFLHHWPSRASPEMIELRERFLFFKKIESSRFLKQRRIALRHLVRFVENH